MSLECLVVGGKVECGGVEWWIVAVWCGGLWRCGVVDGGGVEWWIVVVWSGG